MRVGDVLRGKKRRDVVTVRPSDDLAAAVGLLLEHTIGGLPVVPPGGPVLGFVSERDVVRAVEDGCEGILRRRIDEIMATPAPLCEIDDPLHEVMARMTRDRLRHLVVVDGDRIEGILSIGDLVKQRIQELETEAGVLRDYLAGQRARE
ncbi:MAG: CBS domain-containing protein [Gemmatimonadetes bacterium]|nr:CBS domain-containing protein [Gemmatimonadota bacterium]NIR80583.1 CBS domain-containing protein [Gemmatimonadota bacterium]NIT89345.1 CBS domain-containing protein [Gemmatimonadota bacterium]NIU33154.1 CBS domain-containing protein [Gemmatimonadota bacterium]NIU37510.1 CBS domain-containing protein [Gemmatimonadota bacterium]